MLLVSRLKYLSFRKVYYLKNFYIFTGEADYLTHLSNLDPLTSWNQIKTHKDYICLICRVLLETSI